MEMWKLDFYQGFSTIFNGSQAACRFVFFLPRALAGPRRAEKYVFQMVFKGFGETVSFPGPLCFLASGFLCFPLIFNNFDAANGVCVFF